MRSSRSDHVSNYIKMCEDADMKWIGAKFDGQELRVTGKLPSIDCFRPLRTCAAAAQQTDP